MNEDRGTQPSEVTSPGETATTCPVCGTARTGGDRFCEACGHDFQAPLPARWELLIEADRAYHARFDVAGAPFPEGCGATSVGLDGEELRIGRREGAEAPQITGAADDPALSRRHAVLRRAAGGGYTIEDLGSTNGTEVNGRALAAGEVVALGDGDRVCIGAWTAMTIRSRGA
jgi:hypothetical protein